MGNPSTLNTWIAELKQTPAWTIIFEGARSTAAGAAFGAALTAAGVHLPEVIVNQFRLSDFRMFQVFTVALGSSVFVILVLDKLGLAKRHVRPATSLGLFSRYDGNIIGGVLVGLGMSLSGSCPGTVTAQIAQGVPTAGVTALGGLLGGVAHIWLTRPGNGAVPRQSKPPRSTPVQETIPEAIGIRETSLYTAIAAGWLSLLYFSTSTSAGPFWRSAAAGGLYLGSAQLVSLLATSSTLGSVGIYDQAGRYVLRLVDSSIEPAPMPPKSLLFGVGAVAGSWTLTRVLPVYARTSVAQLPWSAAFSGGFIMAFGAKTAKGCTSGHGLSGMGALSLSSLISVVSMFCAGILSRSL